MKHYHNLVLTPSIHVVPKVTAPEGLHIPATQNSQVPHIIDSSFSFRQKAANWAQLGGAHSTQGQGYTEKYNHICENSHILAKAD